ncbi:mitochondrial import inner membrane translocase subunit Tim29-like [Diadema setosum]|uniref:mitochondrial import inner membrane translocase subunit Tim29-like n=1 Tax=Diadema antillarum TaxID=105358 RepID=UPI003A8C4BBB
MAASMRGMWSRLSQLKQRIVVPERLQRGLPKKISDYVQNMYRDYKSATLDIFSDMKERPIKAGFYITSLGLIGYTWRQNPSEEGFDQELVEASNDLLLLSNFTRNPDSDRHVQKLLLLRNNGVLRYMNLGVCSIVWEDNFDKRVSSFDATCKHLKVSWREFPDRIRDVGFMGRWFYLSKAMEDYDVNYLEFQTRPATSS